MSLRNLGPLLKMVWQACPMLILSTAAMRLVKALVSVGALRVSKLIIDALVASVSRGKQGPRHSLWVLVAIELSLAIASDLLGWGIALPTACSATVLRTRLASS